MVCISHRIQKKVAKQEKEREESDRKEEKDEREGQMHGMSHEKKLGLLYSVFFLSRSLSFSSASRSRNSGKTTIFIRPHHRVTSISFFFY